MDTKFVKLRAGFRCRWQVRRSGRKRKRLAAERELLQLNIDLVIFAEYRAGLCCAGSHHRSGRAIVLRWYLTFELQPPAESVAINMASYLSLCPASSPSTAELLLSIIYILKPYQPPLWNCTPYAHAFHATKVGKLHKPYKIHLHSSRLINM